MNIGKFFKNLFSKKNVATVETFAISEVQQLIAIVAPGVQAPLVEIINTLANKTIPSMEKLEALSVEAIRVVASVHGLALSKDIALALAQKVYTDAKDAVRAEAIAALTKL